MSDFLRIALAQINPIVGDLEYNENLIADSLRKADRQSCDIVLFPELALCGYPPEDLLLEPKFIDDTRKHLLRLAKRALKSMAVVGYAERFRGLLYNSAAVIADGRVAHSYKKVCLPNYGVFDERRYFASGPEIPVFDTGRIKIGINICEDIWIEPGPGDLQAERGASLVITINSSPYHVGKSEDRIEMLRRFAKRNSVHYAYVNVVGGQDELVFDGTSVVIDPKGKLLAVGNRFENDLILVDIPMEQLEIRSRRAGRRPELESARISFPGVVEYQLPRTIRAKQQRLASRKIAPALTREEEIYRALVTGTKDYLRKNGFTDTVVGLSGGIDSALTAIIAHEVVGSRHLHLVYMPTRFSSKTSENGAKRLAANLGVKLETLEIDNLYEAYKAKLAHAFRGLDEDITEENIQARIRGNILMAFSNKFNWLVLTTGNKSEIAVGYCTLYGDTAGGYAVIKDVYKTMVFRLARWINRQSRAQSQENLIPPMIITRPPSAELRPNQKDSDSLPPYDVLDKILIQYVERGMSPAEIAELGYDIKLVSRIVRMVDTSEYKRRQAAPGVKITPRGFGKDRRMPITNCYRFK
jgi:NAD+ synthase (glutamine-hydrolysing)